MPVMPVFPSEYFHGWRARARIGAGDASFSSDMIHGLEGPSHRERDEKRAREKEGRGEKSVSDFTLSKMNTY